MFGMCVGLFQAPTHSQHDLGIRVLDEIVPAGHQAGGFLYGRLFNDGCAAIEVPAPGYASALLIKLAPDFGSATHHSEHMHQLEYVFALGNASASSCKQEVLYAN